MKKYGHSILFAIGVSVVIGLGMLVLQSFYETASPKLLDEIEPDLIKGVPAAFVSLVIGILAAYIAMQQYRVARAKFKLDLFERRYVLFEQTWGIVNSLMRDDDAPVHEAWGQLHYFSNARFLFDADVADFIAAVNQKASDVYMARVEIGRGGQSEVYGESKEIVAEASAWASKALATLEKRFSPYLSLAQWK